MRLFPFAEHRRQVSCTSGFKSLHNRPHDTTQGLVLPEDLDPRVDDTSLRVVPIPTFLRELVGALDDVELAEEGLLPSTESSSSKFLSEE